MNLSPPLADTKRALVSEKVRDIKGMIKDGMTDLEEELNSLAAKNKVSIKTTLAKSCSLIVNDQFHYRPMSCPYIYIESKYRSKERAVFKGLGTIDYKSFRLTEMSDFKSRCRENVESAISHTTTEIKNEVRSLIHNQLGTFIERELEQYTNSLQAKLNDVIVKAKQFDDKLVELQKNLTAIESIMEPVGSH